MSSIKNNPEQILFFFEKLIPQVEESMCELPMCGCANSIADHADEEGINADQFKKY